MDENRKYTTPIHVYQKSIQSSDSPINDFRNLIQRPSSVENDRKTKNYTNEVGKNNFYSGLRTYIPPNKQSINSPQSNSRSKLNPKDSLQLQKFVKNLELFPDDLKHFLNDPVICLSRFIPAKQIQKLKVFKDEDTQTQTNKKFRDENTQTFQKKEQIIVKKRLMLRPQDMRQIHREQAKERPKTNKIKSNSLNTYMIRMRQKNNTIKMSNLSLKDLNPKQDIQLEQNSILTKSLVQQRNINDAFVTIFETATPSEFKSIQYSGQGPQRTQNITSKISVNPQASRLVQCKDIQKRFSQKRNNDKIDSTLIVTSREGVMNRVKLSRSRHRPPNQFELDEGISMVPCGPKHLRARLWPIKADLFVMKMQDNSLYVQKPISEIAKREDYFVQNTLDEDPCRIFKRINIMAHRYLPEFLDYSDTDYQTIFSRSVILQ